MQYSIMTSSLHAVNSIPKTYLLYNWSFYPLSPFIHFSHDSALLSSETTNVFFVCQRGLLCVCVCDVLFLCFCVLDSTYKWDHMVFVFFCLMYFTEFWTMSFSLSSEPVNPVCFCCRLSIQDSFHGRQVPSQGGILIESQDRSSLMES